MEFPCPLQSVVRNELTLPHRRFGLLGGRHNNCSHVPETPLHVSYLQSYLNALQRWLSEWILAINLSKSTRDTLYAGRTALHAATTNNKTNLVDSNQSHQEEGSSNNGYAVSPHE